MKSVLTLLFATITFTSLTAQNIPVDFESTGNGADWNWTVFENDTNPPLEIVANPDMTGLNTSATVAKFTALQAGQPFAGCESLHGAGIGSFTIDASNAIIRIMVWKSVISDVGIKLVRSDNWSLGEIKIPNTVVNQWEQIEFDFSAHIGNPYDQIVIFPDFNARSADQVIYFDAIYGEAAVINPTINFSDPDIKIFPNPVINTLTIDTEKIIDRYEIYSMTGNLITIANSTNSIIDINHLAKGVYLLNAHSQGEIIVQKFIKQ